MVVKPSIQFLNLDSDDQLVGHGGGIMTGMTGNPSYVLPVPGIPAVQTALDEFSTAVNDSVEGGMVLTAIKKAKRAVLVALLRQLASYVQVTCNGDMAVLLSSGFPIQKPQRTPIGVLPAPTILSVSYGPHSGELVAAATPLTGAGIYNWRLTTAAAPNVVLQTAQTTAASNTFAGLTPGVVYSVTANAVGSAGPSDWSDPVPQMAV